MKTIRFGRTGSQVSAISFGTWSHGGPKTVDDQAVGWSGHDDDQAVAALALAAEGGIVHWDTADVYGDGNAERLIGRLWTEVPRERIFLASKIGWDPGPYGHAYHPRQIEERLERSLELLGTDYLDLYYFHNCDFGSDDAYLDDAVALFRKLRDEGKIRSIGLSDWDLDKLTGYAERVEPDVVQPYRNVVDDDMESSGLAAWVEANDAGVAYFSPLKHGLLLGKYERPMEFAEGDMRRRIHGFRDQRYLDHLRRCREEVTRRFRERSSQPVLLALLGALLADSPSGCVLLGMRNPAQVEAAAAIGELLGADEALWVRDLYQDFEPEEHDT
jgi:aryl-alcohol dehydrogenase-like predicted oxidoreductase